MISRSRHLKRKSHARIISNKNKNKCSARHTFVPQHLFAPKQSRSTKSANYLRYAVTYLIIQVALNGAGSTQTTLKLATANSTHTSPSVKNGSVNSERDQLKQTHSERCRWTLMAALKTMVEIFDSAIDLTSSGSRDCIESAFIQACEVTQS